MDSISLIFLAFIFSIVHIRNFISFIRTDLLPVVWLNLRKLIMSFSLYNIKTNCIVMIRI